MTGKPLWIVFALLLSSCAVGPDYEAPKNDFLSRWFAPESAHVSSDPAILQWWTVFQDPLLEGYIKQAAAQNKDVKIALANLREARAARHEKTATFFPQIDSSAGAERSKASDALSASGKGALSNLYDAGFDASWELDIFGGNRRAGEASGARAEGALADYHAVMLSTLSEVARNYYEARGLQKRIAITTQNADFQEETFNVIQSRVKAGEASEFDLTRAQGEVQLTRARIPNLQADLYASVFSLSILLGQPPESLLEEMRQIKPLPTPPDLVPVGLRSDILRRRPDVRAAERELAASIADIGAEESDLFPKFFLTGDAGSQARVFGDLFSAAGGVWSLGSLVQWPVFQGGAIRARIAQQEAQGDAALAFYEKTVLQALGDTETALTRYGQELETRKRLDEAVQSRRKSVSLARQLFDAGETDYLAVLDAERELTASEDELVTSETRSITSLVALFGALGGGWEVFDQEKDPESKAR